MSARRIEVLNWHEQVKAAMIELYGPGPHPEFELVFLDNYRGMTPEEAAEKIVADVRAARETK